MYNYLTLYNRVWVNIVAPDGSMRRLPGWPNEPLNHTISRYMTEGFNASCDGGDPVRRYSDDAPAYVTATGPTCGKCHVVVSEPWYTYMKPKIHPSEQHAIENTNRNVFAASRLACCIALKPWMNEIICRIIYEPNLHRDEEYSTFDSGIGGASNNKSFPY
jgi:hypothetical protein